MTLAYRMLGDAAAADDIVQTAWIRWQQRPSEVSAPHAYLVKVITHLCINELESARARRESYTSRLPDPIESDADAAELYEGISMAFLVLLQRLSPAERAVLLMHEIFGYEPSARGGSSGGSLRKRTANFTRDATDRLKIGRPSRS